jgi:hypothetical protein
MLTVSTPGAQSPQSCKPSPPSSVRPIPWYAASSVFGIMGYPTTRSNPEYRIPPTSNTDLYDITSTILSVVFALASALSNGLQFGSKFLIGNPCSMWSCGACPVVNKHPLSLRSLQNHQILQRRAQNEDSCCVPSMVIAHNKTIVVEQLAISDR